MNIIIYLFTRNYLIYRRFTCIILNICRTYILDTYLVWIHLCVLPPRKIIRSLHDTTCVYIFFNIYIYIILTIKIESILIIYLLKYIDNVYIFLLRVQAWPQALYIFSLISRVFMHVLWTQKMCQNLSNTVGVYVDDIISSQQRVATF